MKANISENGTLTIRAETPLESYALRHWHEGYCDGITSDVLSGGIVSAREFASVLCIDTTTVDAEERA